METQHTMQVPGNSESRKQIQHQVRRQAPKIGITLLGFALLLVFILPLGYMVNTAFKLDTQTTAQNAPMYPASPVTFSYQGKDLQLYYVPINGETKQLALLHGFRENSEFIDPANPDAGVIAWTGRYRTLTPVYQFNLTWDNIKSSLEQVNFVLLFRNTLFLAIVSTIGTLFSCVLVAYGFSRFPIPGKNILFIILISTIVLPPQATIIPLFILFTKIGWTGTWLPLLVPAFFANAYDVFLLRQYLMGVPKDLDEAAMIDGASPLRILVSVIIPQALPAIVAVTLFHFFYVWNDYFTPLVYLVGKEDLYPISVGIGSVFGTFTRTPGLSLATALIAVILPAIIFFMAQRQFTQGIVMTGVEK
jgi:multiple sugar transport system permease protein